MGDLRQIKKRAGALLDGLGRTPDEVAAALAQVGVRQADPEVEVFRAAPLLLEEGADGQARHAPHDLPGQRAVGERVVSMPRARNPPRLFPRQLGGERGAIAQTFR